MVNENSKVPDVSSIERRGSAAASSKTEPNYVLSYCINNI
jgi:hypothetical protein